MAFNLSKNNTSGDNESVESTSSKFNLSKDVEEVGISKNTGKPMVWLIGLIGLLIVVCGLWLWFFNVKAENESEIVVTDLNQTIKSSGPLAVENTPTEESSVNAVEAVSNSEKAAALNNKIPATFDIGSASFSHIDQSLVKNIISYLVENPKASVCINGYASSDGPLEINQIISQTRADTFKKYLVSKSISGSRVVAYGKGIEKPIASNNTNAGRNKNRRVEIIFLEIK